MGVRFLRRRSVLLRVVLISSITLPAQAIGPQVPTFNAGTDLIRLEVQVVDRDGGPVAGLGPDQFDVRVGGRPRRVQFAEFVRARADETAAAGASTAAAAPSPGADSGVRPPTVQPRLWILALDLLTFRPAVSYGLSHVAGEFLRGLPAGDAVGLFAYPLGPKVEPTTDRGAVARATESAVGEKPDWKGEFNLDPSELVDYLGSGSCNEGGRRRGLCTAIVQNRCGTDRGCAARLDLEARTQAAQTEAQAEVSIGMLRQLIERLDAVNARKILVLASAGLPLSDRPGARPDVGEIAIELGKAAARANVSVYTLFVDNRLLETFSAENRFEPKRTSDAGRSSNIDSLWLQEFTGGAGGEFLRVMTGQGEQAFARIARETSAYYLLGVETLDRDRKGSVLPVQVKVDRRGVSVQSRRWVAIK